MLTLVIASTLVLAQSAPTAPALPSRSAPQQPPHGPPGSPTNLQLDPPAIDLGRVAPASRHPVSFTLRNVSAQPLRILEAKPSCKCTTFDSLAGRVLAAGASLRLDATFDAPTVPGEKDAHIFIAVEGFQRPAIAIIRAKIVMPIESEPPYVDIRGGNLRSSVRVTAIDGKPFRIRSAGGAPPRLLDEKGAAVEPGMEPQQRFVVLADFSKVPPDKLMQYWLIETDRDDCPIVPVQVRHEATGLKFDPTSAQRRWLFGESLVNAGRLDVGETYEGVVEITDYKPRGVETPPPPEWSDVRDVRSASPLATVELKGKESRGGKVSLPFRFTPTVEAAGQCIYVPVVVTTATGEGRFYVAASVSTRTADGTVPPTPPTTPGASK